MILGAVSLIPVALVSLITAAAVAATVPNVPKGFGPPRIMLAIMTLLLSVSYWLELTGIVSLSTGADYRRVAALALWVSIFWLARRESAFWRKEKEALKEFYARQR